MKRAPIGALFVSRTCISLVYFLDCCHSGLDPESVVMNMLLTKIYFKSIILRVSITCSFTVNRYKYIPLDNPAPLNVT